MAERLTVDLPDNLDIGERIVVPLPPGDWIPPEGWERRGNSMHSVWMGGPSTVTFTPVPDIKCGLCAETILPTDLTVTRAGVLKPLPGVIDAHQECYDAAVAAKVSRKGGPAERPPKPSKPDTPGGKP